MQKAEAIRLCVPGLLMRFIIIMVMVPLMNIMILSDAQIFTWSENMD